MKENEFDYILGIDETGQTIGFENKVKLVRNGSEIDEGAMKHIVTLIKIKSEDFKILKTEILKLKSSYSIPIDQTLHAVDFVGKRGLFSKKWKINKWLKFMEDVQKLLFEVNFKIYFVHSSVVEHIKMYSNPFDPYQLSISYLFERVFFDLKNNKFKIYIEGRGQKEDVETEQTIRDEIISKGYEGDSVDIRFDTKKSKDYSEVIELCDIICYLLRFKLINKNNQMLKLQSNGIFKDEDIEKLFDEKMKYRKKGYDWKTIP